MAISLLLLWCVLGPEIGNLDPDHCDKWQAHNHKPDVKENGAYKSNSGQAKTAPNKGAGFAAAHQERGSQADY